MSRNPKLKAEAFVKWFRTATPYIHQWGGATFVIAFGGEVLADGEFQQLTHDINVLVSLEVRVVLVNHGESEFRIEPGDRIGQLLVQRVERAGFSRSQALAVTSRGEGGFGSTGR